MLTATDRFPADTVAFYLVEGVVDHHLLGLHRVRDDVEDPLPWLRSGRAAVCDSQPARAGTDRGTTAHQTKGAP